MNIGLAIKTGRKRKGLDQKDLAKIIGVTPTAIGYWERGERLPSGDLLIKIANELDIVSDLFPDYKKEIEILGNISKHTDKIISFASNDSYPLQQALEEIIKKEVERQIEDKLGSRE